MRLAALALCLPLPVDDLELSGKAGGDRVLQVDISWTQSWRGVTSGDGVWLFVKRSGETAPVLRAEVASGALEASASRDGQGVFVTRSERGEGKASGELVLTLEGSAEDSSVHGVEMVQVRPETGPPTWLAKNEVSQGDYVAFLNEITNQATFHRAPLGGRGYGGPTGTILREEDRYTTATPEAPAGFLSWHDACAFADWAGLRPPRASELNAVRAAGALWEPAISGRRLALTHGDGDLTREGGATNADWSLSGRSVVLAGMTGTPPTFPVTDRRANLGFRPARTVTGSLPVLLVGTDALEELPAGLHELSRTSGVSRPLRVTARVRAGDRFERMASSRSLIEELESGRFEVVLLQEDLAVLGGARRSAEHAKVLVEAARRGGATPVVVLTWGLRDRPSVAFETAAANVRNWAEEMNVLVAPLGLAWRRLALGQPDLDPYDEDGRNPSAVGAQLNALVVHELVYRETPELDEGRADLGRVAEDVVQGYVQRWK